MFSLFLISIISRIKGWTGLDTNDSRMCRICHEKGDQGHVLFDSFLPSDPIISPCNCAGSIAFIHFECLKTWMMSSGHLKCSTCDGDYSCIEIKKEPIEWGSLPSPWFWLMDSFLTVDELDWFNTLYAIILILIM